MFLASFFELLYFNFFYNLMFAERGAAVSSAFPGVEILAKDWPGRKL